MNPDGGQRRISDITLEQYLLSELTKSERTEVERAIEEDETIRARLAELEQSNRAILERHPAELVSRKIQTMIDERSKPSRLYRPWPAAAALGAVVAFFLLALVLPWNLIILEDPPPERIKGLEPSLTLFRKTKSGSETLENGERVFPGDVIRIGYQAVGRGHGVIVSVDGRGTVTLHYPDEGNRSVRLKRDGQVLLDFALELDDAPRWERFYFVTSDEPFEVAAVLEAAGRIDIERPVDRPDKLELSKDLEQFVVSLEKGSHR
jgi:hypothetical protein